MSPVSLLIDTSRENRGLPAVKSLLKRGKFNLKYLLAPTCQAVGDGSVEVPVRGPDPDDLGSPAAVLRDHAAVLRRAELGAVVVHVHHGDQDTGDQAEMSMGVT